MHEKLVDPEHPSLRKKSLEIPNSFDVEKILQDMYEVLDETPSGVGLAAPQIGKNVRLFVTRTMESVVLSHKKQRVFINPKIIKKFGSVTSDYEACLSLPGITTKVKRYDKILIEFYDQNWIRHKEIFSGFLARVIQHEQDHLNGKLIIDYING